MKTKVARIFELGDLVAYETVAGVVFGQLIEFDSKHKTLIVSLEDFPGEIVGISPEKVLSN
jgi:hypothetical protein